MPEQGKIIVEHGGQLIVDGGVLTSGCNSRWHGVEVWGDITQSQQTQGAQGKVILKNQAVLENSVIGVSLWDRTDYSTAGGIIQTNDATFRNNTVDVEFMPYQNFISVPNNHYRNMSSFINTTFTVNNSYAGSTIFDTHVKMNYVDGIYFHGCTFENAQTNVSISNSLGNGIFSKESNFSVSPWCDVITQVGVPCPPGNLHRSRFINLNNGIYAVATSGHRNFSVDQSDFVNNILGVQGRAVYNAVITRNNFTIGGGLTPTLFVNINGGIAMIESSGYRIEENNFLLGNVTLPNMYAYGDWILNSGPANNEVYLNSFNQLWAGSIAQGTNRNGINTTGLQFLCNTNSNSTRLDLDIGQDNPPTGVDGIRLWQGDPFTSTAAGNEFSHNAIPEGDIANSSQSPITYLYYNSGNQVPLYYTPTWVTPITGPSVIPNDCPSNFSNGHGLPLAANVIQQLMEQYDANEDEYLNVLYNYNQLIDGGNTNALLTEIENSWSQEAWNLRNELIALSPYVSQEALRAASMKTFFPNAMMLEVSLSNPDATRSGSFITSLQEEIPNPMPQYMTDLIIASWSGVTARSLLEGSLASYGHQMALAGDMLLADLMLDTIADHTDSIRYWLNRIQTLPAKYSLTENYCQVNEFEEADDVLASILNDFTLSPEENTEYIRYLEYYNFRKNIINSNRNLMQLDAGEVSFLQQFSENHHGLSGIMAQNLLCFAYHICTDYQPNIFGDSSNFRIAHESSRQILSDMYDEVIVSPNPAISFAAFSYTLPNNEKQETLTISDLTGRVIKKIFLTGKQGQVIWDTRDVNKGFYLYYLDGNSSPQTHGKILVDK